MAKHINIKLLTLTNEPESEMALNYAYKNNLMFSYLLVLMHLQYNYSIER